MPGLVGLRGWLRHFTRSDRIQTFTSARLSRSLCCLAFAEQTGTGLLAFEITINGQKRVVAASTPNKVLAVGLTWTHLDPEHLRFHIGGIADDGVSHFGWDVPEPAVGDEITIRIVETDSPNVPDRISDPAKSTDRG